MKGISIIRRIVVATMAAAWLSNALGCGGNTSIEGRVTFDGEPVASGAITFTPADGSGPTSGGSITAGRYHIENVQPGEKIVQIVEAADDDIRTPEESAQEAEASRGRPIALQPAIRITEDTMGNNARVTVRSGAQSMDFPLKSQSDENDAD